MLCRLRQLCWGGWLSLWFHAGSDYRITLPSNLVGHLFAEHGKTFAPATIELQRLGR